MDKLIARWQAAKGKRYLELYREDWQGKPSYSYTCDGCGGNLGCFAAGDDDAIAQFEARQVACLKLDFPSVKRVI